MLKGGDKGFVEGCFGWTREGESFEGGRGRRERVEEVWGRRRLVGWDVEGEGQKRGTEGEGFEREGEDGSREVRERKVGEGGEGGTVSCEEGSREIRGSGVVGREGQVFERWEKGIDEGLEEKTRLDSSKVEGVKVVKVERGLRVGFKSYVRGRQVHQSSSNQPQDLQLWQSIEQGYDRVSSLAVYHSVHQHPQVLEDDERLAAIGRLEGPKEVASSDERSTSWDSRRKDDLGEKGEEREEVADEGVEHPWLILDVVEVRS